MNEQQLKEAFQVIGYFMNQWRAHDSESYGKFIREVDAKPPTEQELPPVVLGALKEFVSDILD